MALNTIRPAPADQSEPGLGDRFSSAAATNFEIITPTTTGQVSTAVGWLARRAGLSLSAAAAVAGANAWGGLGQ